MEEDNKLFNFAMECRTLMQQKGFNPIEGMIEAAIESEDPELRFKASKELASYYSPKMGSLKNSEAEKEAQKSLFVQINNYNTTSVKPTDTKEFANNLNKVINASEEKTLNQKS